MRPEPRERRQKLAFNCAIILSQQSLYSLLSSVLFFLNSNVPLSRTVCHFTMGNWFSKPPHHEFPNGICRFLILGKTGTGKSATGNMLLGRRQFISEGQLVGETDNCQRGISEFYHTTLEVIDTPGIFDPSRERNWVETKIAQGLTSLDPGPNIILFTISCRGRFTEEDKKAFDFVKELMGSEVTKYLIVVFTAADELDSPIERNIAMRSRSNSERKTVVAEVVSYTGARYVEFNNKVGSTSKARDKQINELLEIAKKVVAANDREHFCNTMSERITEIVTTYVSGESARTGKSEQDIRDQMKKDVLENANHPVMRQVRPS